LARSEEPILLRIDRREGAVTLTLDNGEVLEVSPDALTPDFPAPGRSVAAAQLREIRGAAARKAVAKRLFQLLDRRLKPLAALRRKLEGEGFDPEPVAAVLLEFEAKGLHSDRRYAEAYCRDALQRRPVGRRYLLAKLREREIPSEIARETVAAALSDVDEVKLAEAAAGARWAQMRGAGAGRAGARSRPGDASLAAVNKIYRFLIGRGFATGLARRVALKTGAENGPPAAAADGDGLPPEELP
jgi:SOS response regulatory protein OraA/RecX